MDPRVIFCRSLYTTILLNWKHIYPVKHIYKQTHTRGTLQCPVYSPEPTYHISAILRQIPAYVVCPFTSVI